MSQRIDKREPDELRRVAIKKNVLSHPLSSVEISFGRTRVICTISVERAIPAWMRNQKVPGGWLTCEYGMLPGATGERNKRESSTGRPSGRSMEIQRLIGRSLRSVVDLEALGQNTVYVDCDVIDADGGTRCASICGASAALGLALQTPFAKNNFTGNVMRENVAAISVGIVKGEPVLDLCYEEDSRAEVDMNVVMTESGKLVEVQGTAERAPFSRTQLNRLLDLAETGLARIFALQKSAMEEEKTKRATKVGNLGDALNAADGESI